jgi:hypothetical protein
MSDTNQDEIENRCEACFGTKQDSSMHSPYPHRKILWVDCPVCKGTGKSRKLASCERPARRTSVIGPLDALTGAITKGKETAPA